jgi:hypothetical protein
MRMRGVSSERVTCGRKLVIKGINMPEKSTTSVGHTQSDQALLELAIEGWRFARLFARILSKLDAGEGARYANQVRYFLKRVEEALGAAGMRLVNLEGQIYDAGFAATALNIEDFEPQDRLYIDQMLEPVIMGPEGLVKSGTIIVKKTV